jgi:hypothetical protein
VPTEGSSELAVAVPPGRLVPSSPKPWSRVAFPSASSTQRPEGRVTLTISTLPLPTSLPSTSTLPLPTSFPLHQHPPSPSLSISTLPLPTGHTEYPLQAGPGPTSRHGPPGPGSCCHQASRPGGTVTGNCRRARLPPGPSELPRAAAGPVILLPSGLVRRARPGWMPTRGGLLS